MGKVSGGTLPLTTRRSVALKAWQKLIADASRYGKELGDEILSRNEVIKHFVKLLVERGFIRKVQVNINDIPDEVEAWGIDSSRTEALRLMGKIVVGTIGVAEKFTRLKDGSINFDENSEVVEVKYPDIISDSVDPGITYLLTEIAMLHREIDVLERLIKEEKLNRDALIIIDGPIVDPPNIRVDGTHENIKDYVFRRADAIRKAINRKATVVGYVKKISGSRFVSKVIRRFIDEEGDEELERYYNQLPDFVLNDWTLMNMLFSMYAMPYLGSENDLVIRTPAFELDDPAYTKVFRDGYGIHIYSTYVLFLNRGELRLKPIVRIDVASPERLSQEQIDTAIDRVLRLLHIFSLPGVSHLIPVLVAHSRCTLPRRQSAKLLLEVVSRYVTSIAYNNREVLRTILYLLGI